MQSADHKKLPRGTCAEQQLAKALPKMAKTFTESLDENLQTSD
jgi:hypothetical protein